MNDRATLLKHPVGPVVVCPALGGATALPPVHELHWTEDVLTSLSVPRKAPALADWTRDATPTPSSFSTARTG
ncbi:hypothetical protein [Streptomyces sp. 3213.3]|uniref:hypothetical protein n=1 Tax=Streptomyces sp. 3213.3 TaxID=1855348 RepID=UPI00190E6B13|nr:hypothetical protein [Streptomyces sp. 3213.3]